MTGLLGPAQLLFLTGAPTPICSECWRFKRIAICQRAILSREGILGPHLLPWGPCGYEKSAPASGWVSGKVQLTLQSSPQGQAEADSAETKCLLASFPGPDLLPSLSFS